MWKELNKSQIPSLTYTSPHPSKCEETKLILYIMIWLPDGGCGVNTLLLTVWILDISARSWDSNIWHNNFVQIMSFLTGLLRTISNEFPSPFPLCPITYPHPFHPCSFPLIPTHPHSSSLPIPPHTYPSLLISPHTLYFIRYFAKLSSSCSSSQI